MVAAALVLCTYPAIGSAAITPTQDAGTVAGAMTDGVSEEPVRRSRTSRRPMSARTGRATTATSSRTSPTIRNAPLRTTTTRPRRESSAGITTTATATSDVALTAFPTAGSTYAILSSGNTLAADDPNSAPDTSSTNFGNFYPERVGRVFDLVTLRIDFNVPAGANCLRLDFRFLSEEFPEFVGDVVNDAFVAELDSSTFTSDPITAEVDAPDNFAFAPRVDDPTANDVVSVNTAGMNAANAAGTTYDGATPLLQASTPVTAGGHSVFLTIFDQGDNAYDSAVFLDNLVLANAPPGVLRRRGLRRDPARDHDRQRARGRRGDEASPRQTFEAYLERAELDVRVLDRRRRVPGVRARDDAPPALGRRAQLQGPRD